MSLKLKDLRDHLTDTEIKKCKGFECKLKLPLEEDSAICVKNKKQYKNDTSETTKAFYNLKSTLYNPIFRGQAYRLDSCFFTINQTKYPIVSGTDVRFDFITKRLYLNIEENNRASDAGTGVIGEMVIVFVNAKNTNVNLNLIIPIFGSNTPSISGKKLIKQIKNADSVTVDSVLKLNTYIPRKTNYYYLKTTTDENYINSQTNLDENVKSQYKKKLYHNLIFKNSQISINEIEYIGTLMNQSGISEPDQSITEHFDCKFLRESIIPDENTTTNGTSETKIVKKLLLSNGIFDNVEETSIINCEPVDDNGMLLIDREKGLGESGITKTTSMEQLQKKYTEGAMAQLLLGAALLFLLSSFFKSTLRLLDKDK